jgi:hypothetical protein
MEINLRGIKAEAKKEFQTFQTLRPSGVVSLVHDPDNEYDKFCIRVVYETADSLVCLGYIPAKKVGKDYVGSEVQKHIIDNGLTVAMIKDYAYTDTDGETWNHDHVGHLQSVTIDLEVPENDSGKIIGGRYLRVTDFISYFSPYGKSDGLIKWAFEQSDTYEGYREALNKTAEAGTAMHSTIEAALRGEKADGLPAGWDAFVKKYDLDPCYMEKRFYDNDLMVTGQPDFVGFCNGKLMVLDWKSSKKPSLKHAIQLAVYAKNAQWDGKKPEGAMVCCFGAENKQGFSTSTIDAAKIESIYIGMKHVRAAMDACGVWISEDKHYSEGE